MLALTERATEAIDAITGQPGLPDEAGLRISSAGAEEDPTGQSAQLAVSLVEAPEEGDRKIEEPAVYVEPGATEEFLDDKILDAEVGGGEVKFSIAQQPSAGPGQDTNGPSAGEAG